MNQTVIGTCFHCGRPIFGRYGGRRRSHAACAIAYARSERRQREGSCIACGKPRHAGRCSGSRSGEGDTP